MDETDIVDVTNRITKFSNMNPGKVFTLSRRYQRMYEIVDKINNGLGSATDLDLLGRLGTVMSKACLCGLGQAAPSPVLTTLQHFRSEYSNKL